LDSSVISPDHLSFSIATHLQGIVPQIDTSNPIYKQLSAQWHNQSAPLTESALTAYDSVLLLASAYEASVVSADYDALSAALVNQAEYFYGASGYARFSSEGDRASTTYAIYAVNLTGWYLTETITPT